MNSALRAATRRQLEDEKTYTRSWWRETPWKQIDEIARASMTPAFYAEWIERPDVVERKGKDPQ